MNPLAQLDLGRFRIDAESFVGQTIELGIRFQKLPEQTGEALLAFLRVKGMYYGKRNRAGIAISREGLERGVRQALICTDLGLMDRAEGDLNRAVELLAEGDFEGFRKRGYELAFFRLEEMSEMCRGLLRRSEIAFLPREQKDIRLWSRLAPETWVRPPEEDEDEPQLVDPRHDYAKFREIKARLDFLRSVPRVALEDLKGDEEDGRTFDGVLRNLILALALDLETLLPDLQQVRAFQEHCFEAGKMRPQVRKKVLYLINRQLEAEVEEAFRPGLQEEIEKELETLEALSGGGMAGLFIIRPAQIEVEA